MDAVTELLDPERGIEPGEDRLSRESRAPRSTAVIVAGMHRSGTSALVRVLALLGLDLPKTLYPTRPDNPLGYWESLPVVEAHEEFLAEVGSSFDDFSALSETALRGPAARTLEDKLVQILEREFGASPQFVVKDPRLCRVVPIWLAALMRFGAAPRFVLPLRHPLEVAASLKLRNEYGTTKSLLLWLRHVLEAEQHTRGLPRSVVSYEHLLRDWRGVVTKISHELDIVWPRTSHETHAEVEQFLSPRRRHHTFAADELEARRDVVDWVKTTYGVLAAAAEGEQLEQQVLDAVRGELDRADRAFGPLLAELNLTRREQEARLSAQATKLAEASAESERQARALDDSTHALAETRAEVERLQSELTERQEALATATSQIAGLREETQRLRAELDKRTHELDQVRAEVPQLAAELAEREEALAASVAEVSSSRQEVERLRAELEERDRELAEARRDIPSLESELTERQEALATATSQIASLREETQRLRAELDERERLLAEARADVPRMTTELAEQREALRVAAAQAAAAHEQVERLHDEMVRRAQDLADARADVQRLRAELAQREVEREEASASINALGSRVQSLLDEAAAQETRHRRALNEIANLQVALAERAGRVDRLRAAVAEMRRQRAHLARELTRQIEELKARKLEHARLQTERDGLRAQVADLNARLTDLEQQNAELAGAIAAHEDNARHRIEELRQRDEADKRNAALIAELREQVDARMQAEANAKNDLDETRAALDATRQELDRLLQELAEREVTLGKLQIRRFVRPRTKWLAISQFLSWLVRPHRGGWRLIGQYWRLRRAGTFPKELYLAENPDVDASGLDPLMHYVEHGIREGRIPSPSPAEPSAVLAASAPAPTGQPALPPQPPAPAPIVAAKPRAAQPPRPSKPLPPSDYSDFIVLLSRQRSGTNPLRTILDSHPDVFCFNEVFNLADRDSDDRLLRESNFFTFLERYAGDDIRRAMADNHERLFLDYLEYLRCLSQKRYALIDVKYNTTHFLVRPWQQRATPYLIELIIKHGIYVLHVTRRNYLRYVLSTLKAWRSNRYTVMAGDAHHADVALYLDPGFVLDELSYCREEDERIQRELAKHDRMLTFDYAEIFPGNGVVIAPTFLERFSAWRGVATQFVLDPKYQKQSTLPLPEAIENYDEIAAALRDGPFEYCLDDEPAYRDLGALDANAPPQGPRVPVVRPAQSDLTDEAWQDVIGSPPDSFSDHLRAARPAWVTGSLSWDDTRFLFRTALEADADEAVEIGTASGFSTAVLAHALSFRAAAGRASEGWRVRSYDIQEQIYFDHDRRVGDAARELLPGHMLEHVEFNAPATAIDVGERHATDSIRLLFLDANHQHPWPALDLLAVLDTLRVGATVLLHDVNLPRIHAAEPWGVTHLFEDLDVEKFVPDVEVPNIGAFVVPEDKRRLREQLLAIVQRHRWEVDVPSELVRRVAGGASSTVGH